jgi:hypothetical protein
MKALSNAETIPTRSISILSLSPDEEDHNSLKCILNDAEASTRPHSRWILLESYTRELAFALLQEHRISIVLLRKPPAARHMEGGPSTDSYVVPSSAADCDFAVRRRPTMVRSPEFRSIRRTGETV